MSKDSNNHWGGESSGCLSLFILFFLMYALIYGLPVPGGTLHIDIFAPAIRLEKP